MLKFEDTSYPYNERPFLDAGLATIYVLEGENYPLGTTSIGSSGGGVVSVRPEHINQDLTLYNAPSMSNFEYIHEGSNLHSLYPHIPRYKVVHPYCDDNSSVFIDIDTVIRMELTEASRNEVTAQMFYSRCLPLVYSIETFQE
jgi:hypothetical protein